MYEIMLRPTSRRKRFQNRAFLDSIVRACRGRTPLLGRLSLLVE